MSCDRDRRDWWGYLTRWFRHQSPPETVAAMVTGMKSFAKAKAAETAKGGSGRRRAPASGDKKSTGKGKAKKSQEKKTTKIPFPKKGGGPDLPEYLYSSVKQAAVNRERDWAPAEREEIARKARMLRRWIRTVGGAPLEIDPAHGDSDLPKISSQAGFAAVYDWMDAAKIDLSSPLDPAYQAIWEAENSYSEKEKIELHRVVEEIDVQLHRGDLRGNPGKALVKKLKENRKPKEIQALLADEVRFAAFYPKEAKVEKSYTMLVYTHLESAWEAVQRDAGKFEDEMGAMKQVRSTESPRLPRGTAITVVPTSEGVEFEPAQVTFRWREDYHRAEFHLRGDRSLADGASSGWIHIYADSVLVAMLKIGMLFCESEPAPTRVAWDSLVRGKLLLDSQIFISYSHKDNDIVEIMRRMIKALGYRTLMDIHDLGPGRKWDKQLKEFIEQADIFQLFWSVNAAGSKFVKREWKYALKCKKTLVPVYWKEPITPTPPKELGKIQFGYLPVEELKSWGRQETAENSL